MNEKKPQRILQLKENIWKNRKLFFCIALNAFIALTAVFLFNIVEKTDDLVMKQILDGAYSGSPDAHLLYFNYIWGSVLLFCKKLIPGIPWVEVSQLGLLFVAFNVITYELWDERNNRKSILTVIPVLLFFGIDAYVKLTFSKTAGIVSIAGFLCLMMNVKNKESWKAYVIPVLLVVIGTFYRSKCALLTGGMFCIFMALSVFADGTGDRKPVLTLREMFRQCAPLMAVVILSFLISQIGNVLFTRDPEWARYKEYNEYKVELQDKGWPDYSLHEAEYLELGISRNDFEMWDGRDYSDPEKFTIDLMAKVCEMKEPADRSVFHFLRLYPLDFFKIRIFLVFVLELGLLLCSEDRKKYLIATALIVLALGIEYFLFIGGRYGKYHVDYVIFLALSVAVCLRLKDLNLKDEIVRICPLILMAALVFVVNRDYNYLRAETYDGTSNSISEGEAKAVMQELTQDKDNLYILSNNEYYGLMRSKGVSQCYYPGELSNIYVLSGYMTPTTRKVLDDRGIYNIYKEMLRRSDIFYVTSKDNRADRIRKYLRENYCGLADYRKVNRIGDCIIYQYYMKPPKVAATLGNE